MFDSIPGQALPEILELAPFPILGIGRNQRLAFWNRAAAELLGLDHRLHESRACFEVIRGRDVFGNPYCMRDCQVARCVRAGRAIVPFRLRVSTVHGERELWFFPLGPGLFPLAAQFETDDLVTYFLLDCARESVRAETAAAAPQQAPALSLTAREREVLNLVADARTTAAIARELSIKPNTVRNHIQSILRKLAVHSRIEAVTVARALGLIEDDSNHE